MILHLDMKGEDDIQIKFDNGSLIQICIIVFVMKKIVRYKCGKDIFKLNKGLVRVVHYS